MLIATLSILSKDPITKPVMEGLGYGTRDLGAHLWTNSIPVLLYGTAEQKKR